MNNTRKLEKNTLDIFDVIDYFYLHKWIVITIIISFSFAGGIFYSASPKVYHAELNLISISDEEANDLIMVDALNKILLQGSGQSYTLEIEKIDSDYLLSLFVKAFNSKQELRESIKKNSIDLQNKGDYSSLDEDEFSYDQSKNYSIKEYEKNKFKLNFSTNNIAESKLIIDDAILRINERIRNNFINKFIAFKDVSEFNIKKNINIDIIGLQISNALLYLDIIRKNSSFGKDLFEEDEEDILAIEKTIELLPLSADEINKFVKKSHTERLASIENVFNKIISLPILKEKKQLQSVSYDFNLLEYQSKPRLDIFLIVSFLSGVLVSIIYIFIIISYNFYKNRET